MSHFILLCKCSRRENKQRSCVFREERRNSVTSGYSQAQKDKLRLNLESEKERRRAGNFDITAYYVRSSRLGIISPC